PRKIKNNPYQAVLWDLGGVLVRTFDRSGRARWEEHLGLEPNELSKLVFEGEMSRKASIGKATTEDIWHSVSEQFDLSPKELEDLERDYWAGDRVDQELIAFIRSLRPEFKTGLISNAWPDLRPAMEGLWHIADAFDEIVISAEVGMVKPDARIYHMALDRLEVKPEQAIFVDDFPENVAGAKNVGIHAILFLSTDQVLSEIRSLLDLA
ncbi:MAG: HAD-IA family hydrolase, partial [Anaerolineales bacterium]|nr:HAD-IA family hydrolase [Anaerolineales bacterium]